MNILGINAYHGGASACLIRDGQLIAAAEEERFNRVKYCAGFPVQAIRFCLAEGGITGADVEYVGISRDPRVNLHRKILHAIRSRPKFGFLKDRLHNMAQIRDLKSLFCTALQLDPAGVRAEFHNVEHHRAHMASAFFVSPFQDAAIVSIDGMGDFTSTMWGFGSKTNMKVMGAIHFPHSLGYFYTAVSQWLGFTKYGDEGKVMGLVGFGQPAFMDRMRDIVRIQRDGTFELGLDYFVHHTEGVEMTWAQGTPVIGTMYSKKFVNAFGPPRAPGSTLEKHHFDVAASLQLMLEEAEFALIRKVQKETGSTNLCLAGGVALNSVFNGKVLPETDFREIYIQPAASDAGTSLGVAYYIYHQIVGRPRTYVMTHAYTGPQFANGHVASVIGRYGLKSETHDEEEVCRRTARMISQGDVVGWFQGPMEWGPRALGNRSILADPRRAEMKDILNARIKHREPFRPFAPSILLESVGEYFDQSYPDPFMLKVYSVLPEKRGVIPAVTHVDGTGRLQTVGRETAPKYWQIIKEFEGLTGVPVLLNTSFNENEPIVCQPEEAIECYLRTKMDALVLGNHMLHK